MTKIYNFAWTTSIDGFITISVNDVEMWRLNDTKKAQQINSILQEAWVNLTDGMKAIRACMDVVDR